MSEEVSALKKENERLKIRLKTLGREKANLQMAVHMVNEVAKATGLSNVVDHILQILVSAIGGSNIAIYYETEGRWKYTDMFGQKKWMDKIDDSLVHESITGKRFVKKKESGASELNIPGFPKTYETWVYPLQVHGTYFGALRLQGMAIEHAHYRENIDPFIQYSALVLYHEVSNIKQLTIAYQKADTAKNELEKSQERFELAMKFANEGLFDWDLRNNTIYFSPVWKSLLGYADDEIKNDFSEWERLTHPEDVKASWAMLTDVLEGKRNSFEKEFQMRHKDGHWVDILSRANVIFNDKKEGLRVVGTHVDVSNIKQMEKELRESEVRYRSIMEATKDPTYICSEAYQIEYMNPAMIKWLGGDHTGAICYEAIHGQQSKCSWCPFSEIMSKKSINQEFISPRNNRKYLSSNSPIVHVDGSVSKLTVYHDVTDLIKMEKRLQQAQKMESIGNLAGGIAHDFNNILTPIIGMSELLLSDMASDSIAYDNAKEILTAGKRGADLVKQILTFSKQTGDQKLAVQFQQILKEVLKLCRSTIPADITISEDISIQCGKIFADPTQLHQVGMNLITNAYHAVENNSGEISISLKEVELEGCEFPDNNLRAGKYAALAVSDNGVGIESKWIHKIFEPYFTTKEQGKGTGLGLATVYGIIKEHDGDIRVYSALGKGTTFNVYLPIVEQTQESAVDHTNEVYPTGSERVLIVDDEPSIAKLGRRMLERLGYDVTALNSSIEALEVVQKNPHVFDLVITDMTMPNLTGDKLAKEILAINPDMPIIICTGYSDRLNQDKSYQIGVKAFLMKPVAMKDLSQTVRKVLDQLSGTQ